MCLKHIIPQPVEGRLQETAPLWHWNNGLFKRGKYSRLILPSPFKKLSTWICIWWHGLGEPASTAYPPWKQLQLDTPCPIAFSSPSHVTILELALDVGEELRCMDQGGRTGTRGAKDSVMDGVLTFISTPAATSWHLFDISLVLGTLHHL